MLVTQTDLISFRSAWTFLSWVTLYVKRMLLLYMPKAIHSQTEQSFPQSRQWSQTDLRVLLAVNCGTKHQWICILLLINEKIKRCWVTTVNLLNTWWKAILTGGPSAPGMPGRPGFPVGPWEKKESKIIHFLTLLYWSMSLALNRFMHFN